MTKEELILEAIEAMKKSYSPYSKFAVGAAILTKDGRVFHGTNIENASYGLAMCAERNAIFNAYCNGVNYEEIEALAIVANSPEPVSPCGSCRQVIYELCPVDTKIYLANTNGDFIETNIESLLPYAFKADDMDV